MTKAKSSSLPKTTPGFEDAMTELEGIVARMESGTLSLEDSLGAYRRGAELLKLCQAQLVDAETQLRILDADTLVAHSVSPDANA